MTAFRHGLDVIFSDPNMALAATWRTGGTGTPVPVQVIRRRPDVALGLGDSRVTVGTERIDVRASEIAAPKQGDTVTIGTTVLRIMGQPERDGLNLVWKCEARP